MLQKDPDSLPVNVDNHYSLRKLVYGLTALVYIFTVVIFGYVLIRFFQQPMSVTINEIQSQLAEGDISPTGYPDQIEGNQFNSKLQQIRLAWSRGDFQNAIKFAEELERLAATDPDLATAYYWQGVGHYNLHDIDRAESLLLKAVEIDAENGGIYSMLAAVNSTRQKYDLSVEQSLKCIELEPQYGWCYNNLGVAYVGKGEIQKAVESFQKAVELDPTNVTFQQNLRRLQSEM